MAIDKLKLNDLEFKAYLEDSDMTYEMKDQQLPFAPTSFNNDSAMIRVLERAKFTFNVFSEDKQECLQNYNNLQNLLNKIKPSYKLDYDQYIPDDNNIIGYFNVEFPGIPRNNVTLHLTNFSYNINKDLGYLEIKKGELKKPPQTPENNANILIPIAYKISIEGKVLLPFNQTAKISEVSQVVTPTGSLKEELQKIIFNLTAQANSLGITLMLLENPLAIDFQNRQQSRQGVSEFIDYVNNTQNIIIKKYSRTQN